MKKFFIKSSVLTVIVFVLGTILYSTILKPFFLGIIPFEVLFFYFITNLVHAYLLNISNKSANRFTSKYLAASFLKMFFYLVVAIVFVIFNREIAKPFLVNYLLLYVVYTIFEVSELSRVMKN